MDGKELKPSTILKILEDPQKIRKFTEMTFAQIDFDGSGYLEFDEFAQVMNNVAQDIGIDVPESSEMQGVWDSLDDNDDG